MAAHRGSAVSSAGRTRLPRSFAGLDNRAVRKARIAKPDSYFETPGAAAWPARDRRLQSSSPNRTVVSLAPTHRYGRRGFGATLLFLRLLLQVRAFPVRCRMLDPPRA